MPIDASAAVAYCVRQETVSNAERKPTAQLQRHIRYDLHRALRLFERCLRCNGLLTPVAKADVLHRLQPLTRRYYENFYRCADCGHIYYKGSHVENMRRRFSAIFRRGS